VSQESLRTAFSALPGRIHDYAGIDRAATRVVNVSIWTRSNCAPAQSGDLARASG